jgi:hypothetical protein
VCAPPTCVRLECCDCGTGTYVCLDPADFVLAHECEGEFGDELLLGAHLSGCVLVSCGSGGVLGQRHTAYVSFLAVRRSERASAYCVGDLGAGGFGFLSHEFSPARGWVGVRDSRDIAEHLKPITEVFETGILRYSR